MSQRFSHQRERIYQTVCASGDHPTAELVYRRLRPELPRLSIGTVYRNLQQMAREGRLRELAGPVTRYDAWLNPHTHFCCTACGDVRDLPCVPYDAALDAAVSAQGYLAAGHALMFTGLCPGCAARQQESQGQDGP